MENADLKKALAGFSLAALLAGVTVAGCSNAQKSPAPSEKAGAGNQQQAPAQSS